MRMQHNQEAGEGRLMVAAKPSGETTMNGECSHDRDTLVENVADELAEAAYPVALRLGLTDTSIDLELELWQTLTEAVRKWERSAAWSSR
jgi:hypothetical protein